MALDAHPSTWLDVARAELFVPTPGADGWQYQVPKVDLVDGPSWLRTASKVLVWRTDGGGPTVTPSGSILEEFVRLSLVPDAEFEAKVLAFAQRFGVLRICRHGKPDGHRPGNAPRAAPDGQPHGCYPMDAPDGTGWQGWPFVEPIEAWRRYSRQLRAILGIGARLQCGSPGLDDDWQAVVDADPASWPEPTSTTPESPMLRLQAWLDWSATRPDFTAGNGQPVRDQKGDIRHAVGIWLRYGRVELAPAWLPDDDFIRPRHRIDGLGGTLAVFLLAALANPLYVCAGCGTASRPGEGRKRRPRTGTRFWCSSCGRAEQKRAAARQHYRQRRGLQIVPDSQSDSQE